jgi:hypothetical protein
MAASLKDRVAALEKEVARLRQEKADGTGREWLNDLYGRFAGDPVFEEAMKLGRKYRKSQVPRNGKSRSKK